MVRFESEQKLSDTKCNSYEDYMFITNSNYEKQHINIADTQLVIIAGEHKSTMSGEKAWSAKNRVILKNLFNSHLDVRGLNIASNADKISCLTVLLGVGSHENKDTWIRDYALIEMYATDFAKANDKAVAIVSHFHEYENDGETPAVPHIHILYNTDNPGEFLDYLDIILNKDRG